MPAGSSGGDNTDSATASRINHIENESIHFAQPAVSILAIVATPLLFRPDWSIKHSRRIYEIDAVVCEVRESLPFVPLGVHSILHALNSNKCGTAETLLAADAGHVAMAAPLAA